MSTGDMKAGMGKDEILMAMRKLAHIDVHDVWEVDKASTTGRKKYGSIKFRVDF